MLHMNEYQMKLLNQSHRDDLLRQAEHERLANEARQAGSPSAYDASLARLGGALMSLGERLQSRAEQPAQRKAYR
jgi:hypothetical protein